MGKKRKELSEAEIWDDSALINSWNESYEEYKMYHSLHAQGVNIQEFLKQQEEKQDEEPSKEAPEVSLRDDTIVDNEAATADAVESEEPNPKLDDQSAPRISDVKEDLSSMPGPAAQMPQFLMGGSTQSEELKNLMMSWYWAGYYTGLHEGRQQGQTPNSNQKTQDESRG